MGKGEGGGGGKIIIGGGRGALEGELPETMHPSCTLGMSQEGL